MGKPLWKRFIRYGAGDAGGSEEVPVAEAFDIVSQPFFVVIVGIGLCNPVENCKNEAAPGIAETIVASRVGLEMFHALLGAQLHGHVEHLPDKRYGVLSYFDDLLHLLSLRQR